MAFSAHSPQNKTIRCNCNEIALIRVSQKPQSKGRKFYGCPNYGNEDNYCDFFMWYDKKLSKLEELSDEGTSNFSKVCENLGAESRVSSQRNSQEWMQQHINYELAKSAERIQNLKVRIEEAERKIYYILFLIVVLLVKIIFM